MRLSAWQLTPIRGSVEPLRIGAEPVTFGRAPECTVVLNDDLCSRRHAAVEPDGRGGIVVRDLGSRNGTKVNDSRIAKPTKLAPGDMVRIGGSEFLVELTEGASDAGDSAVELAPEREAPIDIEEAPSAAPALPMASRRLPWAAQLLELIDALPPQSELPEKVTLIDAAGRVSAALAGSSDGPNAVRLLIQTASKAGATDVHCEPKGEHYRIRMRVDGQMIDVVELPNRVGELVHGLIKTACNMQLAGREAVQEGHFSSKFEDRRVDYRVSFTPSVTGQKLVLRVLDERGAPRSLIETGLLPYMADRVRRVCMQESGLLMVCGPTGSGKTTTLYNALREVDRQTRNVITIEDPVEYQLDGVTQIPIDESKGNTFNSMLRSVVRQDPDVILVGEIRDEETARTAMQAAMTGHVVFTTVHAKDTIAAVFRLLDLKVEPYLVANALDLVLAQRLVRVLCEHCKRPVQVAPGTATRLGRHLQGKVEIYQATGCSRCLRTGYRGRRALFELLDFNDELRDIVLKEPTIAAMKRIIEQGLFTTLAQFGWRLVAEGTTSLEEVDSVAGQG